MGNFFMSAEDKEILAKIEAFTPEELELYNKNNFISLKDAIKSVLFYELNNMREPVFFIINKTGKTEFPFVFKDSLGKSRAEYVSGENFRNIVEELLFERDKKYIISRKDYNEGHIDCYGLTIKVR